MAALNFLTTSILLFTYLASFPVAAQTAVPDTGSAEFAFIGCKNFLLNSQDTLVQSGYCLGAVEILALVSVQMPNPPRYCIPDDVTTTRLVQVFVDYASSRSSRLKEPFVRIALEAWGAEWPCNH